MGAALLGRLGMSGHVFGFEVYLLLDRYVFFGEKVVVGHEVAI